MQKSVVSLEAQQKQSCCDSEGPRWPKKANFGGVGSEGRCSQAEISEILQRVFPRNLNYVQKGLGLGSVQGHSLSLTFYRQTQTKQAELCWGDFYLWILRLCQNWNKISSKLFQRAQRKLGKNPNPAVALTGVSCASLTPEMMAQKQHQEGFKVFFGNGWWTPG